MSNGNASAIQKTCTKCLGSKREDEFGFKNRSTGKLKSECKSCESARMALWYEANKEKSAAAARAWYATNRERGRANAKRWAQQNPEARNEYKLKRPKTRIPTAAVESRVAFFGGKCWMCGAPATTVDHVKPVSRGGPNIPANIRPACRSCNARKHNHWYGVGQLARFIKAEA